MTQAGRELQISNPLQIWKARTNSACNGLCFSQMERIGWHASGFVHDNERGILKDYHDVG